MLVEVVLKKCYINIIIVFVSYRLTFVRIKFDGDYDDTRLLWKCIDNRSATDILQFYTG